jgi:hypothetical protein
LRCKTGNIPPALADDVREQAHREGVGGRGDKVHSAMIEDRTSKCSTEEKWNGSVMSKLQSPRCVTNFTTRSGIIRAGFIDLYRPAVKVRVC